MEEAGEDVEGDARAEGEKDGAARQEEKASYTGGQSTVAGREGACHGRHEDLCEGIRGENEADHEGGGVEGGGGGSVGWVEGPQYRDEGKNQEVGDSSNGQDEDMEGCGWRAG